MARLIDDLPDPGEDTYEAWSRRGSEATRRGEFEAASAAYQRARELADDLAREHAAMLNLAMVRLQEGRHKEGEEGLREILMRTDDPRIAFSAAYHLASSLRKQARHERALAYAKRAMERAVQLGSAEYLAPAHNLLGNIHLARSYMDEALAEYQRSLALRDAQEGDTRYSRAILLENIGSCLLLLRRFDEGVARIEVALSLADEVGDRRCRAECLQDLCYAFLLQGRHDEARARGDEALGEALEHGYGDVEENCHYLLGELGTRIGDLDLRDRHLDRLQALHPELPFLRDFLCAVDVTSVLTLKR